MHALMKENSSIRAVYLITVVLELLSYKCKGRKETFSINTNAHSTTKEIYFIRGVYLVTVVLELLSYKCLNKKETPFYQMINNYNCAYPNERKLFYQNCHFGNSFFRVASL